MMGLPTPCERCGHGPQYHVGPARRCVWRDWQDRCLCLVYERPDEIRHQQGEPHGA